MPTLPKKKMAFWSLELNGKEFNDIKRFISSITVEYELNKIAKATLQVESISYLENYFKRNQEIKIKMGWDSLNMVEMFNGIIDKNPEGDASDYLSYSVPLLDKSAGMARREKNQTFPSTVKSSIIRTIAGTNGYSSEIDIKDSSPVKAKEMPIQKGKTDLEFLRECALKWNCLFWINSDTNIIYFMDSDTAHKNGDLIHSTSKFANIDDLAGKYKLGYKTDYSSNNVAKVQWKYGTGKNGNVGSNVVNRTGEKGKTVAPEDFVYEFYDQNYKFSPDIIKKIKADPSFATKIISESVNSPVDSNELTKYWIQYPADGESKTNKNLQSPPVHKVNQLEITVDLNVGDAYLRPPRQATLFCGSDNPRSVTSDLPGWLVNSGSIGRDFYMNKVKHTLSDGMIKTTMELSK